MSGLAGRLRERVTLRRRGAERDVLAGAAGGWTVIATMAAAIAPDGRSAITEGGALSGAGRWRVIVRTPCAAQVGDRIEWGTRRLAVRQVVADPLRPDRIEIFSEEER